MILAFPEKVFLLSNINPAQLIRKYDVPASKAAGNKKDMVHLQENWRRLFLRMARGLVMFDYAEAGDLVRAQNRIIKECSNGVYLQGIQDELLSQFGKDHTDDEEIIRKIDDKVMQLFPGIKKHILFKHTTDVNYIKNISGRHEGDVIGLAQNYDQVGKNRPGLQTPIDGLFLVGSDAGGNGVGTEMAADSALQLERLITQKYEY